MFLDFACRDIATANLTNYIWVDLVALQPKAKVCTCLIAGIAGSNSAEGMDVRLVCCVGIVRGVMCDLETSTMRLPRPDMGCSFTRKI